MTFRQKEFCCLYAAGHPASKAATGAGYAKATAERNAAHFLSHPAIAARISRLRYRRNIITPEDLDAAKQKVMHILATSTDAATILKASQELCRLAKMQQKVEIDPDGWLEQEVEQQERDRANLQDQIEEMEELREQAKQQGDQDQLHRIDALLTDSQGLSVDKNYAQAPRQFDRLPSGKPAFDLPATTCTPAKASDIREAFRLLAQRQIKRAKPQLQTLPQSANAV